MKSQLLTSLPCHSLFPGTHTDFRKRHCHILNSVSFLDSQFSFPGISDSRMQACPKHSDPFQGLCVQPRGKQFDGSPNHWELVFPITKSSAIQTSHSCFFSFWRHFQNTNQLLNQGFGYKSPLQSCPVSSLHKAGQSVLWWE